jgi:hypothetical protein
MKTWSGRVSGLLAVAALMAALPETVRGFATLGQVWPAGTISMMMQLTGGSRLSDGSDNFNAAAGAALAVWNTHVNRVRFAAVDGVAGPGTDGDLVNQVFFDSRYYGTRFGTDTLAITTRWYLDAERVEGDVVFNNAFSWDSYPGTVRSNGTWDIRRVALHEFGHVLGLDHPDQHGQQVEAMMNSIIGNRDALTADDIAGAQSLYGLGVTGNTMFPPRNEPNAFFQSLQAVYRDELHAPESPTFLDAEGAVTWLTEYARQRVGQCSHATATANTLSQITSGGGSSVCAETPPGGIPFPPRNEGLQFMNQLDNTYRFVLQRPPGLSFVNNEGAVVWVLEYLRYRLNGCTHGDAATKVLQQIRGQGVQPVCAA